MLDVLGEVVDDAQADAHRPLEAAFARLNRIRTFRTMLLGFAAMGFGLFTGPVLQNLYLDRHFDLEHVRARRRRHRDGRRRARSCCRSSAKRYDAPVPARPGAGAAAARHA